MKGKVFFKKIGNVVVGVRKRAVVRRSRRSGNEGEGEGIKKIGNVVVGVRKRAVIKRSGNEGRDKEDR